MRKEKIVSDWSIYPNFTKAEFDCDETGANEMTVEFMDALQAMRTEYKKGIIITSGFRHVGHRREKGKIAPGNHTKGIACDIGCGSDRAFELVALAFKYRFTGIGISQRSGTGRFIHLDRRLILPGQKPVLYSY